MKSKLTNKFAGQKKPVIAMVHFPPNPGTPLYDEKGGIKKIYKSVYTDAEALVKNGVKSVMFCNEGDRPYLVNVGYEIPTTMAAIISRVVSELNIKTFGVDILWAPKAALALAKATGASFIREVFTGVYAGDNGLWKTNCGEALRYRKLIDAEEIQQLYNINAEFAYSLDKRDIVIIAKSVVFSSLADIICISGPMTGMETSLDLIKRVKDAMHEKIPIFANTGVNIKNVKDVLEVGDGLIIGSYLKKDGVTWNPVDPERVKKFIDKVNSVI